jgi:hypothetical protein
MLVVRNVKTFNVKRSHAWTKRLHEVYHTATR